MLAICAGVEDFGEIMDCLVEQKVVLIPGSAFACNQKQPGFKCPYFRLSYACASEAQMMEGFQRLRGVLLSKQRECSKTSKESAMDGGYHLAVTCVESAE